MGKKKNTIFRFKILKHSKNHVETKSIEVELTDTEMKELKSIKTDNVFYSELSLFLSTKLGKNVQVDDFPEQISSSDKTKPHRKQP